MPTYEYECSGCKRRLDVFQVITAKPLTKCARCSGRLKRLMGSGSGFLFKGKGFYITDYRSKGYLEAKKKDQPSASPSSGTASGTGGSSAAAGCNAPPS